MLGLCTWQCSPEHRRPHGALGHASRSSGTQTRFSWGLRAERAELPLLSTAAILGTRFEAWVPPMLRGKHSGLAEVNVQSPSASCPQPRSHAASGPWARLPSARTPNISVTQIANLFSAIWQRSFCFRCSWSPSPPGCRAVSQPRSALVREERLRSQPSGLLSEGRAYGPVLLPWPLGLPLCPWPRPEPACLSVSGSCRTASVSSGHLQCRLRGLPFSASPCTSHTALLPVSPSHIPRLLLALPPGSLGHESARTAASPA